MMKVVVDVVHRWSVKNNINTNICKSEKGTQVMMPLTSTTIRERH